MRQLIESIIDVEVQRLLIATLLQLYVFPFFGMYPTWVEWLMGYPAGYTDLKDWEILSSRKSRKKSATPSSQQNEKKKRKDVPITK